jgi:hypothetical protein
MDSLALAKAERPYYLEYRVREGETIVVRAELGALVEDRAHKRRRVWVDLRVGGPDFDNTNFLTRGGVAGALGINLPLEDDYGALRDALWLATDRAYKASLENLAQKKAYVENRTVEDYPGDLCTAETTHVMLEEASFQADRAGWRDIVRELSAAFARYPRIRESGVSLAVRATNQHFLNSEGSRHARGSSGVVLTAVAYAQCDDGMKVGDRTVAWWSLDEQPARDELLREVEALAERVSSLSRAPRGDDYVGPVVFSRAGAGEFWAQTLLANLSTPRTPLGQASLRGSGTEAVLVRKLRRRILPEGIDVVDDPTLSSFGGQPLLGAYPVDDDGVLPSAVHLVRSGRLTDLLMSRIPTKELRETNGHGRGSGRLVDAQPSNTLITDRQAVAYEALLAELEDLCAASDLPYGLVVERLSPNWWADTGPAAWYRQSWPYQAPLRRLLGDPIVVYRVWFDEGRLELVRGLEFSDVTVRALKDILLTGDSPEVLHYLTGPRGAPPDLPASVVAPPVLLEEMELRRKELEETTLPHLPHPLFE